MLLPRAASLLCASAFSFRALCLRSPSSPPRTRDAAAARVRAGVVAHSVHRKHGKPRPAAGHRRQHGPEGTERGVTLSRIASRLGLGAGLTAQRAGSQARCATAVVRTRVCGGGAVVDLHRVKHRTNEWPPWFLHRRCAQGGDEAEARVPDAEGRAHGASDWRWHLLPCPCRRSGHSSGAR